MKGLDQSHLDQSQRMEAERRVSSWEVYLSRVAEAPGADAYREGRLRDALESDLRALQSFLVPRHLQPTAASVNVMAQSSYLSVNDRRLRFGLGSAISARLEIRWPNGLREKVEEVASDELVVIHEGSGVIRTERFPPRRARP